MSKNPKFEAITAIVIVEERLPFLEAFQNLEAILTEVATDHEIVVVANSVSSEIAQELRTVTERFANVTVHFLAQRIDRDAAVLIGIDQALGDWVIVLTPTPEEVANLASVLEQAGEFEVVFAGARSNEDIPATYRAMAQGYFKLYEFISGLSIDWPAPRIRVYSRAAARYLATTLDGEFALRSLNFSGAFPGVRITLKALPSDDFDLPSFGRALRKALRGLLNASAVPLRAVIATALLTGLIAVFSSLYALASYLMRDSITPGWTTLSLQISLMTFLLAVMFALLAEYVLNVYRAMPPRRRVSIVREIRSPMRRQSNRLNVIGSDGSFQLGAPSDAVALAFTNPQHRAPAASPTTLSE